MSAGFVGAGAANVPLRVGAATVGGVVAGVDAVAGATEVVVGADVAGGEVGGGAVVAGGAVVGAVVAGAEESRVMKRCVV